QTLLPVARRNLGRGEESVAIFQVGTTSLSRGEDARSPVPAAAQRPTDAELEEVLGALPLQTRTLAAVVGGASGPDSWQGEVPDWGWADAFDLARRAAAAVGAQLEVRQVEKAPFHPGRAGELRALAADGTSTVIGHAGELHPAVVKEFDVPARTSALELDLEALIDAAPPVVAAAPVPTYPVAKEDFAFVVDQDVPASAVEAAIVVGMGDLAERVHLFDVFTGEQIGEGRKSLAFAVRLRSVEGTLTAEQIGAARQRCITAVETAVGGVLRACVSPGPPGRGGPARTPRLPARSRPVRTPFRADRCAPAPSPGRSASSPTSRSPSWDCSSPRSPRSSSDCVSDAMAASPP